LVNCAGQISGSPGAVARDQQYEHDGGEEDENRGPDIAHEELADGLESDTELIVVRRVRWYSSNTDLLHARILHPSLRFPISSRQVGLASIGPPMAGLY
jgi:hypothetical protein